MSLFQQADLPWNEPPCSAAVGRGARGAAAGRPAGGSRGPPPRALPQGRAEPVRSGPVCAVVPLQLAAFPYGASFCFCCGFAVVLTSEFGVANQQFVTYSTLNTLSSLQAYCLGSLLRVGVKR